MEQMESTSGLLNLILQPAFTVKNGVIDKVNEAAQKYLLEPNIPISDLLLTGNVEYEDLKEGCLYLTLSIAGTPCGASVHRMEEFDLFTLEQEADQAELQAMALAAQELRKPLSNVMAVADQLFPVTEPTDNSAVQEQISRINRGLFQMLRVVSNMSDAYRYSQQRESRMTVHNVAQIMEETFQKCRDLLCYGDRRLQFTNLTKAVLCLVDREKLERAVLNMISNAVKFSEKDSVIEAKLTCRNETLYLTVQDKGTGIQPEQRGNVHARFRRQPRLEDSRFGIGLGMVMIRSAATIHGGTVLIDHPDGVGSRITMSIPIRQSRESMIRARMLPVDYAGGRDHSLIELSDVLPASAYQREKIN